MIEDGIEDNRATGSALMVPLFLVLKAEALHLADRTSEAFENSVVCSRAREMLLAQHRPELALAAVDQALLADPMDLPAASATQCPASDAPMIRSNR